ncbi:MAG: 5-(carboxyamino)imidazole ribonucleotide mutase [Actinomycetota bacterium]|nr:5-(carboxyamino)imidazole ribonucleotide mutase [Actinomycetota bacterium]
MEGEEVGNEAESVPVVIAMGSDSDLAVMTKAKEVLDALGVASRIRILSAHRTPAEMFEFARSARDAGVKVIIAGAGGAAHLPGMIASSTTLPVIGVPVALRHLSGLDSLLSIVQMPRGVPVATVAIDNATNAGYLAARILSLGDPALAERLAGMAAEARSESLAKDAAQQA